MTADCGTALTSDDGRGALPARLFFDSGSSEVCAVSHGAHDAQEDQPAIPFLDSEYAFHQGGLALALGSFPVAVDVGCDFQARVSEVT